MISFGLIIIAGIIRVFAVYYLNNLKKHGINFSYKENKRKVIAIRITDYFGLVLILIAILFAVIPSLRKLQ